MSKPKAIVLGPLPPPYGGVSVFMASIKDACLARGIEVWSNAGDGGDPRVKRVNHRALGHLIRLLFQPRGARITDSTHFHLEHPHWLLLPAWLLMKQLKRFTWVKICHDATLPTRYEQMDPAKRRRVRRALSAIDELVVYSDDLERWFKAELDYGGDLHFGPFLTPLEPSWGATDPADLLRNVAHTTLVSSVGVFLPFYGFDKLATAVEKLRASTGRDIGLVLLDGGFANDDEYRVSVLRGRPWIHVLERVPHPDIGSIMKASDVFVRPVEHESYGRSRVEALLSGTPVVATNVGETRGMRTYRFDDVDALTAHIEAVLNGDDEPELEHWAYIYTQEATTNLGTYLRLIAGEDADA